MTNIFRQFLNLFKKKYAPLVCLFILILISFSSRFLWMQREQKQFNELIQRLQVYLDLSIKKDQKPSKAEIQNILETNPRAALFVYDNQLERNQIGFLNVKSLDMGATELTSFFNQHKPGVVLKQLAKNPQEFSNEYLRIEERQIFRTMNSQTVKVGKITIGFLRPGYLPEVPKIGGYYGVLYKGWMLFLLSNMMLYPVYLRRKKVPLVKAKTAKDEKNHLEWLEKELVAEEFEEDTTRDSDMHKKTGWTELFNQSDIKDWNVHGYWYVRDQTAIGFPWGSSITTKSDFTNECYEFEIEAQRMVGPEGFVVLFRSQGKQLSWIIGGWKNSRSEVMGYENTKTADALEKYRWYYIKIESDTEKLTGFLDGRKVWEIEKKAIKEQTTELGFQQGFGVGVWASMAKFQRIRIISTET